MKKNNWHKKMNDAIDDNIVCCEKITSGNTVRVTSIMSPREKYASDSTYRALVEGMVVMCERCQVTPSELREASILASIIHHERLVDPMIIPTEIAAHLSGFEKWLIGWNQSNEKGR